MSTGRGILPSYLGLCWFNFCLSVAKVDQHRKRPLQIDLGKQLKAAYERRLAAC